MVGMDVDWSKCAGNSERLRTDSREPCTDASPLKPETPKTYRGQPYLSGMLRFGQILNLSQSPELLPGLQSRERDNVGCG